MVSGIVFESKRLHFWKGIDGSEHFCVCSSQIKSRGWGEEDKGGKPMEYGASGFDRG
jgi:hypothetical protein